MEITIALIIAVVIVLSRCFRVINEYERAVIFRLGRIVAGAKGPGLIILVPVLDKMVRVDMRTIVIDVEKQDVITRDNVSVGVNAVVYLQVIDSIKSVIQVENYLYATGQLAQTTLRSVAGQAELDELLSAREKINNQLQDILDQHTDPWGVKVTQVELKHIDLPVEMKRSMAREAE
ncbi:MAG: SPFH domain-containing protein, partial [Myxococcota bacterium]|nr:SPFH domain-containing protein [Myxococcota bacterium]